MKARGVDGYECRCRCNLFCLCCCCPNLLVILEMWFVLSFSYAALLRTIFYEWCKHLFYITLPPPSPRISNGLYPPLHSGLSGIWEDRREVHVRGMGESSQSLIGLDKGCICTITMWHTVFFPLQITFTNPLFVAFTNEYNQVWREIIPKQNRGLQTRDVGSFGCGSIEPFKDCLPLSDFLYLPR